MRRAVAPLLILLATISARGSTANPYASLPTRVLEIEGGTIEFQGVLILDTRDMDRLPLKYVLAISNANDFPVWVQVDWRAPGEAPFSGSVKFEPKSYREAFLKIRKVAWNAPIPVKVTIYADEKKSRALGGREVTLLFREGREAFERKTKEISSSHFRILGQLPTLEGFQEMNMWAPTPGTAASRPVAAYIKREIWANQSRHHWDCSHEIVGVRAGVPRTSIRSADYSSHERPLIAEEKQFLEEVAARDDGTFEEWQVKSCDSVRTYLVVMRRTSTEDTRDLLILRKPETAAQE